MQGCLDVAYGLLAKVLDFVHVDLIPMLVEDGMILVQRPDVGSVPVDLMPSDLLGINDIHHRQDDDRKACSELAFGVHGELEVNVDPGQRHVLDDLVGSLQLLRLIGLVQGCPSVLFRVLCLELFGKLHLRPEADDGRLWRPIVPGSVAFTFCAGVLGTSPGGPPRILLGGRMRQVRLAGGLHDGNGRGHGRKLILSEAIFPFRSLCRVAPLHFGCLGRFPRHRRPPGRRRQRQRSAGTAADPLLERSHACCCPLQKPPASGPCVLAPRPAPSLRPHSSAV
mmetsp:Transcript_5211/g.8878  ORF Transcript_5211/g.8878 Transcript_5211/m.8878 type:complete len:281 (-) Transcript_5211:502-1344(-)